MISKKRSTKSSIFSFRQFYFCLALATFVVSCIAVKKESSIESYLPKTIEVITLGMPLKKVLEVRPKIYIVNSLQETPRHIYTEELDAEEINSIYYFFDKTDSKTLVEVNLLYNNEEAAFNYIKKYFGEAKNSKQNQWHKTLKDGSIVHATCRKQKVFIYTDNKELEDNSEKAPEE